jgi:class III poly(R)-hydroxyalkanoic acid synthase PhaE subunit
MPGDVFRALRPEGLTRAPGDIHGRLDQFLSSPALGYTRESQEKYQKLHRVMLHYQKAMHDYNIAMSKVNLEAVELFQRKMHQLSETDTEITSVKELYVLWVDACEEVYAEYAMSDSYAALYGELVNSLMAVKRQTSRIIDEFLESMNMPTRKEVSTLHKRVQETRRDYNRLKEDSVEEMREELESLRAIKDEIKELRAEVAALKKGTGTSKGKQEK